MTSKQSDRRSCRVRLLRDRPSDEDAFSRDGETGAHERVAIAISDLIQSDDTGGITIALEGGWGSGKSTIVRILEKQLSKGEESAVITFDAWAHEGDPLRRTFLESLIDDLLARDWVQPKKWSREKKKLARRLRRTRRNTKSRPTALGLCLSVALTLIPFGTALVADALREGATYRPTGAAFAPQLFFGTVFALLPLIVGAFNVLVLVCQGRRVRSLDNWAFIGRQDRQEDITETFESTDPTSVEFEWKFTELLSDALVRFQSRRVILIVDNLDRVEAEDALTIWATMQTFLQEKHVRSQSWFEQIWILVPYDPNGIRRLWQSEPMVHADSDGDADESTEEPDDAEDTAESFLAKSFQVRFSVPPPVLSDWQVYLDDLTAEALPDLNEHERHTLYRVFDICQKDQGTIPTPRALKLFVNQVGTVLRQWQYELPLAHVAYYVLRCRHRPSLASELVSGDFPPADIVERLGLELRETLAAIHFNVEIAIARELLLSEPILAALRDENTADLEKLVGQHPQGFWLVVERLAATRIRQLEPTDYATVVRVFRQISREEHGRPEVRVVVDELVSGVLSKESWSPISEGTLEALASLCEMKSDPETTQKLAQLLTTTASKPDSHAGPQVCLDSLKLFVDRIRELGHEEQLPKAFKLPFSGDEWFRACHHLETRIHDQDLIGRVRPGARLNDIESALVEAVNSELVDAHLSTLRVTDAIFRRSTWDALIGALNSRLDQNAELPPEQAFRVIQMLSELVRRGYEQADAALKSRVDGSHTLHYFHAGRKHAECKLWCMYTYLLYRPNGSHPGPNIGQSQEGHNNLMAMLTSGDEQFAAKLAQQFVKDNRGEELWTVWDERGQVDTLIAQSLRSIVQLEDFSRVFTPDEIARRHVHLKEVLISESGDAYTELLHRSTEHELQRFLMDSSEFQSVDAALYADVIRVAEPRPTDPFVIWCRDALQECSAEEWEADLSGVFLLARLLQVVVGVGTHVSLRPRFQDALETHAKSIAAGEFVPDRDIRSGWSVLPECLDDISIRQNFRRRLIRLAIERDGEISDAFFEIYGKEMGDSEQLLSTENIVTGLFEPLVRTKRHGGLQWLQQFAEVNPEFLDSRPTRDRSVLLERVTDAWNSDVSSEFREAIQQLANVWHISLEDPGDEEGSEPEEDAELENND